MAFTYHISFNDGVDYSEFYPSVYPKIVYQQYAGEMFLRPEIDELKIGALLNPEVYATLYTFYYDSSTFNQELRFVIKRDGTDAFAYRTSISNVKIDHSYRIFLITPEVDDACQDILNVYDKKVRYSSLSVSDVSIYYWTNPTNDFVNVDFDTFSDTGNIVTWTFSGGATKVARLSWAGMAAAVGDQVRIVLTDVTGEAALRLVNAGYVGTSNVETTSNGMITLTTTTVGSLYIELYVLPGGDTSGTFTYAAYSHKEFVTGHKLSSYINAMLTKLSVTQTVKSTLLFGDALPSDAPSSIEAFLTASAGYDYVTEATAIFNDTICIASLDYDNTEGLTTSLKDLMEAIKTKLRCFWYIDSDGYMRIEHGKYFRAWEHQLDLTTSTYSKYKPEVDRKLNSFDKSDIFSEIELSEPYSTEENFVDTSVIYDMIKTSPKRLSMSLSNIITDVTDLLSTTDDRSLFFLAGCELISTKRVVKFGTGVITPTNYVQNIYMSWAYLLTKYWQYFGEADEADINSGTTLTIEHVKEILNQVGVKFYYDGILNGHQPIILEQGYGWIKKLEYYLESGFYGLDVGFDIYSPDGRPPMTADSTVITADVTLITADAI